MPKVTQAHRDARRAQIISAAQRVFARVGYGHASMTDIFEEAGLTAGGVYGYFPDKRALLSAAAHDVFGAREQALRERRNTKEPFSPIELVEQFTDAVVTDAADARVLVQLWGEATVDPEIRAVTQSFVEVAKTELERLVGDWLRSHDRRPPPELDEESRRLVAAMMVLAQGYILQRAMLDDFDRTAYLLAARAMLRT